MKYDWDPDDLLNFDYDKQAPQEIIDFKSEEEMRRAAQQAAYLKYRQEYAQQNKKEMAQRAKEEAKLAKREAKEAKKNRRTANPSAAISTATRSASKFYRFTKKLSIPYVIMFAAFTVIMTIMDVLPFFIMVALYAVLGLLSIIIVIQLTKDNVKKWAKVVATVMAFFLMFFYGLGTAYALGTLSFLDSTAVNNKFRTSNITKTPFNVMMTGIDTRGKIDTQGRSDVNMLVTVNPITEQILLTSVPRDYEVTMPDKGYATDKLTHTGFYSVDCTRQAIEELFQTKINYYVKVNFSTVEKFINAIGGIDVESPEEFVPVKLKSWTVKKGMNHMSGKQALAFARERYAFETGDNQRIKNQQLVFEAMINKATGSKTMLLGYSNILNKTKDYFEMSFSSRELRSLVKMQFARGIEWQIYKYALSGPGATKGTYSTGSQAVYVMQQDPTLVAHAQELISAVLAGQKIAKDKDDNLYVVTEEENQENQEK